MFTNQFGAYSFAGQSISCIVDGITYTATIHPDSLGAYHVVDYDCYTEAEINAWKRDEWSFCGIVLSAVNAEGWHKDNLESLWGIELNINQQGNEYLLTVANELLDEYLR